MFKRIPKVRQHDHSDCAAACIYSIASYFGLRVPIARIRQFAATDETGTTLFGLIEAAKELGFVAKGIRAELTTLCEIPKPTIAHILPEQATGHFVVIYKANKKYVRIMDPAEGIVQNIGCQEFQDKWSGVLVLLSPGTLFRPQNLSSSPISRFYRLVSPHRTLLLEALAGAVLYTVLGLSTALYVQKVIDDVLPSGNMDLLHVMSIGMLGLIFIQICLYVGKNFIVLRVGQKLDSQLVVGYYEHLLYLPQSFFNHMRVGEQISRVSDAIKIRGFISDSAIDLSINILVLALSLCIMSLYSAELALVAALIVPIFVALYLITNRLNRKSQRELMISSASLETRLVESLGAVATIKQFGLERLEISKTESSFVRLLRASYSSSRNMILSNGSCHFAIRVVTVLVLWKGAGLAAEHSITPGELISFYTLFGYLTGPIFGIVMMNRTIQDALIATDRLYEIMDLDREADDGQRDLMNKPLGNIALDSVTFRYGSDHEVLSDLSCIIPIPSFTAIVGESGSGKSTLVGLLQRTYPVQNGSIKIGGLDIRHISRTVLRKCIASVPQETVLFAGDIIENVAVGADDPDLRSVSIACELAGAASFIERFPMQYRTPLGDNGLALSGGQRQKIAIARALYRRPEILILDEATSSLDTGAELYVKRLIKRLRKAGTTVIVISHRLSTVVEADQILVLHDGRLQEVGSHEALIRRKGRYYELWSNQFANCGDPPVWQRSDLAIGRLPTWIRKL